MNKEQFSAKWREYKGKARDKWSKLTDSDVDQVNGKWDQLSDHIQKKYSMTKDKADQEITSWSSSWGTDKDHKSGQQDSRENYGPRNLHEEKHEGHKSGNGSEERSSGAKHTSENIHAGEFSKNKAKPHADKHETKEKSHADKHEKKRKAS